jgi:hypothetical protein
VTSNNYMLRALRASRSDPPGHAATDEGRSATYGGALQQFEELLDAAGGVGPASQPLLLFYALSQGGRAVAAAHEETAETSGHGLSEAREPLGSSILHRRIRRAPSGNGSDTFGAVMRATASPDFTGDVELGAAWAAIPGGYAVPHDAWREDWRSALNLDRGTPPPELREGVYLRAMSIGGNPLVRGADAFQRDRYPTVPSEARTTVQEWNDGLGAGNWAAHIHLPSDDATASLTALAPKHYGGYGGDHHILVPTLPGHAEPLTPLALWWVLLFGLSIFARYHPAAWSRALDVQRSTEAVPLEGILDRAGDLLPALIYEALFMSHNVAPQT